MTNPEPLVYARASTVNRTARSSPRPCRAKLSHRAIVEGGEEQPLISFTSIDNVCLPTWQSFVFVEPWLYLIVAPHLLELRQTMPFVVTRDFRSLMPARIFHKVGRFAS